MEGSIFGKGLVLAASPRRGGNSDAAAELVRKVWEKETEDIAVLRVADLGISPCLSCGFCEDHPGGCSQVEDDALDLLRAIATAPAVCLVSPIYFYHLPAQLKILLDRAQAFWRVPAAEKPGQGRPLGLILLAARPRGDKLFEGAVSTLHTVCDVLGMTLAEPLLLRNLDASCALGLTPDVQERVTAYAQSLGHLLDRGDCC